MNNSISGILLGILAYFLLALGFVLQKKGINIFSKERKLSDFILWIIGLILININPLVNFFALNMVPTYVINAISALTIVFTIILSALLLKEKIFGSDIIYIIGITIMIVAITFNTKETTQIMPVFKLSIFFALLPILLFFIILIYILKLNKNNSLQKSKNSGFNNFFKVIIPSATSGSMAGFMVVAMKILQLDKGLNLNIKYFSSIYLYLFLLNGLISFIAIQIAYKNGTMIMIAPLQYGFTVLYPIIISLFLFPLKGGFIESLNIIALAISIFISIWGIVSKHS
ncbi:MAG: DMT family transporter [Exilispira sp.]